MTPPEIELGPWHTAITRRLFSLGSIKSLILRAPDAITLAEVWKLVSLEMHFGRITPQSKTLRVWQECVGQRTCELMEADPASAAFVYNTLFTFFDGAARDALAAELQRILSQKTKPTNEN